MGISDVAKAGGICAGVKQAYKHTHTRNTHKNKHKHAHINTYNPAHAPCRKATCPLSNHACNMQA